MNESPTLSLLGGDSIRDHDQHMLTALRAIRAIKMATGVSSFGERRKLSVSQRRFGNDEGKAQFRIAPITAMTKTHSAEIRMAFLDDASAVGDRVHLH